MKVSGIVNAIAVLQCPLMAQAEWDPTGYTRHLRIMKKKGTKDSATKAASVKASKGTKAVKPIKWLKRTKARGAIRNIFLEPT